MLPNSPRALSDWLRRLSRDGLGELEWILERPIEAAAGERLMREFADEAGDRRDIDCLVLGQVMGLGVPLDLLGLVRTHRARDPVLGLWLALTDVAEFVTELLRSNGPLFPHLREGGLEAWTEAELSGVHALSLAGEACAPRVRSAAQWLMAEMQPDNGTNRPWAAHVFLDLWLREEHAEARLYAEALVHNCRVTLGVPDRFSAVILASSARAIEA